MDFEVTSDGWFVLAGERLPCALGKGGRRVDKREGDGASPIGRFALRQVLYRADRGGVPITGLPHRPIGPQDGWCDDPADTAAYNRAVTLPHRSRCEHLWREDSLYDLLVVLGYNDAPPEPMRGSAIFLHLARPGYAPTEGCVALARPHLLALLSRAKPGSHLLVGAPGS